MIVTKPFIRQFLFLSEMGKYCLPREESGSVKYRSVIYVGTLKTEPTQNVGYCDNVNYTLGIMVLTKLSTGILPCMPPAPTLQNPG